jgi:hypothetical protein
MKSSNRTSETEPGSGEPARGASQVGGFDDWKGLSDHWPLVVDIDINSERAAGPKAGGIVTGR